MSCLGTLKSQAKSFIPTHRPCFSVISLLFTFQLARVEKLPFSFFFPEIKCPLFQDLLHILRVYPPAFKLHVPCEIRRRAGLAAVANACKEE